MPEDNGLKGIIKNSQNGYSGPSGNFSQLISEHQSRTKPPIAFNEPGRKSPSGDAPSSLAEVELLMKKANGGGSGILGLIDYFSNTRPARNKLDKYQYEIKDLFRKQQDLEDMKTRLGIQNTEAEIARTKQLTKTGEADFKVTEGNQAYDRVLTNLNSDIEVDPGDLKKAGIPMFEDGTIQTFRGLYNNRGFSENKIDDLSAGNMNLFLMMKDPASPFLVDRVDEVIEKEQKQRDELSKIVVRARSGKGGKTVFEEQQKMAGKMIQMLTQISNASANRAFRGTDGKKAQRSAQALLLDYAEAYEKLIKTAGIESNFSSKEVLSARTADEIYEQMDRIRTASDGMLERSREHSENASSKRDRKTPPIPAGRRRVRINGTRKPVGEMTNEELMESLKGAK